jgi:TPP-dependent pyruvate/acetoin dehydrogenase alpha subunit
VDPVADWHAADPLLKMVNLVVAEGVASQEEILALDERIVRRVAAATDVARQASFPPAEDAYAHIYAGGDLWPK